MYKLFTNNPRVIHSPLSRHSLCSGKKYTSTSQPSIWEWLSQSGLVSGLVFLSRSVFHYTPSQKVRLFCLSLDPRVLGTTSLPFFQDPDHDSVPLLNDFMVYIQSKDSLVCSDLGVSKRTLLEYSDSLSSCVNGCY